VTTTPASFTADTGASGSLKICLTDATDTGIAGVSLHWANYSGGTVAIGGSSASTIPVATGSDGCVRTTISANSVPPKQAADHISFYAVYPHQSATPADLALDAQWILYAAPTSIPGSGTSVVTLTLTGSNGYPQPGVVIVASCPSSGAASVAVDNSGVFTDVRGQAKFSLTPYGFAPAASVSCDFSSPFPDAVAPASVTVVAPPPVPDHLSFGLQPVDIPEGQRLDGVEVDILKSGSNAVDTADSTTQISLTTTTAVCGKHITFGPITAVKGSADFTDVGPRFYSLTGAPLRLAASSNPKLAGATSNYFNVVQDPADFIFADGLENCSL